jgi:orotate phosphoribosyltransferase
VPAVLAIFTYELDAAQSAFADADVPLKTLTTFSVLRDVAHETGRLSEDAVHTLDDWRRDPAAWSDART